MAFDNDKFIESVREREFLWRKGHPEHKNKGKCDAAWKEIAEIFHFEGGKAAKTKWKYFTDYFSKLKKGRPSGSDGKDEKWPYLKAMSFIEEEKLPATSRCDSVDSLVISPASGSIKSPISNELLELDDKDEDEDENLSISPLIKRRRLSSGKVLMKTDEFDNQILGIAEEIKQSMASGSSPNSQFGNYVGSELKKLANSPERDEAKMGIMNVFMGIKNKRRGVFYINDDGNSYTAL